MAAFILLLALLSPINHFNSDPQFGLLVSQAVLEHGSARLDPYRSAIESRSGGIHGQIRTDPEGWRYAFPLGTPLLSIPVVALARAVGLDMADQHDEFVLQNILSAAVCVVVFLLLDAIGREFVSAGASVIIATIAVLGSPVMSTMATGLWSADYAIALASLVLLWLVRSRTAADPRLVGLALGAAFLCRPQTAPFAGVILVYLSVYRPSAALRAAMVCLVAIGLVAVVNRLDGGAWVPWYFAQARNLQLESIGRHLHAVLASPSRGLFTFCPFFLLPLAGTVLYWRRLAHCAWTWVVIAWLLLHTGIVAASGCWWGGHSFGPRLMADVVPALVLLTVLVWSQIPATAHYWRRAAAGAFLGLGAVGIAIHSGQGLFNLSAARWSAIPEIGHDPDLLVFDWRYPQFLATLASLRERHLDYVSTRLASGEMALDVYPWGARLDPHVTASAVFVGWWDASPDEWWTESDRAYVLFRAADVSTNSTYWLRVTSDSLGAQDASVRVNGVHVGDIQFDGAETTTRLAVEGHHLRARAINTVTFDIPAARFPSIADIRRLGIRYAPHRLALKHTWIEIEDAAGPEPPIARLRDDAYDGHGTPGVGQDVPQRLDLAHLTGDRELLAGLLVDGDEARCGAGRAVCRSQSSSR